MTSRAETDPHGRRRGGEVPLFFRRPPDAFDRPDAHRDDALAADARAFRSTTGRPTGPGGPAVPRPPAEPFSYDNAPMTTDAASSISLSS